MPGHDRCQHTAIWPSALLYRRYDLLVCPVAETCFLVRSQVRSMEDTKIGNFKSNLGPSEIFRRVWFAEEVTRSVAIITASQGDEIFAALNFRLGLDCDERLAESCQGHGSNYQAAEEVWHLVFSFFHLATSARQSDTITAR